MFNFYRKGKSMWIRLFRKWMYLFEEKKFNVEMYNNRCVLSCPDGYESNEKHVK